MRLVMSLYSFSLSFDLWDRCQIIDDLITRANTYVHLRVYCIYFHAYTCTRTATLNYITQLRLIYIIEGV